MRTKREYVVLTFRTTTAAMAMESYCQQAQIPGRMIPVPREITAGCGLAWRMTPEDYLKYQKSLQSNDLQIEDAVSLEL